MGLNNNELGYPFWGLGIGDWGFHPGWHYLILMMAFRVGT